MATPAVGARRRLRSRPVKSQTQQKSNEHPGKDCVAKPTDPDVINKRDEPVALQHGEERRDQTGKRALRKCPPKSILPFTSRAPAKPQDCAQEPQEDDDADEPGLKEDVH